MIALMLALCGQSFEPVWTDISAAAAPVNSSEITTQAKQKPARDDARLPAVNRAAGKEAALDRTHDRNDPDKSR